MMSCWSIQSQLAQSWLVRLLWGLCSVVDTLLYLCSVVDTLLYQLKSGRGGMELLSAFQWWRCCSLAVNLLFYPFSCPLFTWDFRILSWYFIESAVNFKLIVLCIYCL
jgi:hypothetical protein